MSVVNKNIDRFNFRAENYDKFRPGYPHALLEYIYQHNKLNEDSVITELGAGTGILSFELAKWPCKLIAIEPNDEMRKKALGTLKGLRNCQVVNATAEKTTLLDSSIDLIICAQSFHWFNTNRAKTEFQRILKTNRKVAIIWNIRSAETDFEKAYEDFILQFSIDYVEVKRREFRGNNLDQFFKAHSFEEKVFVYDTYLTFEQLLGRTLSYSYMPNIDNPVLPEMTIQLKSLFDKYNTKEIISLSYKTKLFMGRV